MSVDVRQILAAPDFPWAHGGSGDKRLVEVSVAVEFASQFAPGHKDLEDALENWISQVGGRRLSASEALVRRCARLVDAGRDAGTIPAGPPARVVALAFVGALEGAVIGLAGQAPHDELLAARAAVGVLGLARLPDELG